MRIRYLCLIALAAVSGCASAGSGSSGSHRDSNLITAEDIAGIPATNAYEAVERLRPLFLRSRGKTSINTPNTQYPTVYVDGVRYGDIYSLRNILAPHVHDIRFYNGAEAGARFGLQNTAGVIEVKMK
jgi:hypothetical protein